MLEEPKNRALLVYKLIRCERITTLMTTKFARRVERRAGNGSWTAPPRDLNGTKRLVKRQPGVSSPTAGKDQKPSRGVGQSPAMFARAARLFLSLPYYRAIATANLADGGKPNDKKDRRNAWLPYNGVQDASEWRKRFCGAWTMRGIRRGAGHAPEILRKSNRLPRLKMVRLRCKSWGCSLCGPRKANRYRAQILRAVQRHHLTRFLTLTLSPRKVATRDEVTTFYRHLRGSKGCDGACTAARARRCRAVR